MTKNKINIWNPSGCLSREGVLALIEDKLAPAERTEVEKHIAECALCKEALEGFSQLTAQRVQARLTALDIAFQKQVGSHKKASSSRKIIISLAAAVILALIGVFTVFRNLPDSKKEPVAQDLNYSAPAKPKIEEEPKLEESIQAPAPVNEIRIQKEGKEKKTAEVAEPVIIPEDTQNDAVMLADEAEIAPEKPVMLNEKSEIAGNESLDYVSQVPAAAQRSSAAKTRGVRYSEKSLAVEKKDQSETTFYTVEQPPVFQGGDINTFKTYVEARLKDEAFDKHISQGQLTVTFTVAKNGALKDIFVVKGLDSGTDSVAVRIIKEAPLWKPAKQGDKAVDVNLALPLKIAIDE